MMKNKVRASSAPRRRFSVHRQSSVLLTMAVAMTMASASSCRLRREEPVAQEIPMAAVEPTPEPESPPAPLPRTELVPIPQVESVDSDTRRFADVEGVVLLAIGSGASSADDSTAEIGAVERALAVLGMGGAPLDAVAAAVAVLEDSGTRNAGIGSSFRLDGQTVEADAAVADSTGRFGAVAALSGLRNPVLAARAVVDTPYRILAGESARKLGEWLGLEPMLPPGEDKKAAYRDALRHAVDPSRVSEAPFYFEHYADLASIAEPSTTDSSPDSATTDPATTDPKTAAAPKAATFNSVAVLLRGTDGSFAGAMSSGGPMLALPGRVGDVPVPGAALFAGPKGIVVVSGPGEFVLTEQLARRVYDELARTGSLKAAARLGNKIMGDEPVVLAILGESEMLVDPPNTVAFASFAAGRIATSGEESAP